MSLLFWKKNKDIDIFANSIANELYSTVQPDSINDYFSCSPNDKKLRNKRKKVEASIANVVRNIQQFRVTNSLGVYGKARLQLGFTNRLKDLGYDSDVVRKLNEFILVKIP